MFTIAIIIVVLITINIGLTIFFSLNVKTQQIAYDPKSNSIKITSKHVSKKKHKVIRNTDSMQADKEAKLNKRNEL